MLQNRLLCLVLLGLMACSNPGPEQDQYDFVFKFSPGQEDEIRKALIQAKNKTHILLEAGTYSFEKLSLQGPLQSILIEGAGSDKTFLDFSKQEDGGEGFRIENVDHLTIQNLRLQESKGDLLKIKEGKHIYCFNVHTVWDGEPEISNGGYGIYPVLCEDVFIRNCYARGASDAGIYVGQTIGADVNNCLVEYCVAGIEIENTQNAVVYNNEMRHNTGGLLIFDHPGLKYDGQNTEAVENYIHDNNYRNFAPAANNATGVGNLSPGTGILVLRTSMVEIHHNRIENNNTMSVGIFSYITVEPTIVQNRPDWNPIPKDVWVHENSYKKAAAFPEAAYEHELTTLIINLNTKLKELDPQNHSEIQHILYDGVVMEEGDNPSRICIQEDESIRFLNMDVLHDFQNPSIDINPFQKCLAQQPAVSE